MPKYDEQLDRIEQQIQEIWLDCLAGEVARVAKALDEDADLEALTLLDRVVLITRSLREQTRTLGRLAPYGSQTAALNHASYEELLNSASCVWRAMVCLLRRRDVSLPEIYSNPAAHSDLYQILERSIDWDAAHQGWLEHHDPACESHVPLFPELWKVRGPAIQLAESPQ
jgi:tryptophan 2,3-dioxygenase